MASVILENISKTFGVVEAVKNFNLTVEDKEFFILVDLLDVENLPHFV